KIHTVHPPIIAKHSFQQNLNISKSEKMFTKAIFLMLSGVIALTMIVYIRHISSYGIYQYDMSPWTRPYDSKQMSLENNTNNNNRSKSRNIQNIFTHDMTGSHEDDYMDTFNTSTEAPCETFAQFINPENVDRDHSASKIVEQGKTFNKLPALPYQNRFLNPPDYIWSRNFVKELQCLLTRIVSKKIVIVTATSGFEERVFNWLTAAVIKLSKPIENILIISLDDPFHREISKRGFYPLQVHVDDIIAPKLRNRPRKSIWAIRLVLWRIMHHIGFEKIINFDADAIPLQDPLRYFDKYPRSEIIAMAGRYPEIISQKVGFTLNMGTCQLRDSHFMRVFWDEVARQSDKSDRPADDQYIINYTLFIKDIEWNIVSSHRSFPWHNESAVMHRDVTGQTGDGLNTVALSAEKFCRATCVPNITNNLVVSHPQPSRIFFNYTSPNWNTSSTSKGLEWLKNKFAVQVDV
ncbi:unnamed protein product, partial [Owenia fusiformis]